jgi:hypothetical protein
MIKSEVQAQADIGDEQARNQTQPISRLLCLVTSNRLYSSRLILTKLREMKVHRKRFIQMISIESKIQLNHISDVASRNIARDKTVDLREQPDPKRPDKPIQQRVDEALREAEKLRPNDPVFKDMVESRVRSEYNRHKADVTEFQQRNQLIIAGAMNGNHGGRFRPMLMI